MRRFLSFSVVLFAAITVIASCSKKIAFSSSQVVPAAQGSVKVKKDKNGNYAVGLSVKHLAPSKNLTPPRNYYVVWIETENNGTKNIGQITSSTSLLSSTFKASLKAATSFRPTMVFITAEDMGNIQFPGPQLVLKTESFSIK